MPFDAMPDDEYEYLLTLSPAERAQYLAGKREAAKPAPKTFKPTGGNAQQGTQQPARRPFNMQGYSGANQMNPAFMAQQVASGQARHLGGMIQDVTSAYQDENDSRVAQMREQRRMNQEMAIESMRQEALLQRLAMEQKEREKDRILQRQLQTGVTRTSLTTTGTSNGQRR
jgi:hypothetical protein